MRLLNALEAADFAALFATLAAADVTALTTVLAKLALSELAALAAAEVATPASEDAAETAVIRGRERLISYIDIRDAPAEVIPPIMLPTRN